MSAAGESPRAERRTFWLVCAALVVVYAATLAPDVTLWDAGEFNAAIATLGIPHPPGTPLFVLLARVWSRLLAPLPQVVAVNLLSGLATAVSCAILGRLMTRWTGDIMAGVAGGVAAGAMFSVWQNATETEVYALSLLLAVLLLVLGDRAARLNRGRDHALLAYLTSLAVPLQISALVAAPAGVLLASTPPAGRASRERLLALGGVVLLVIGAGLVSPWLMVAGVVAVLAPLLWRRSRTSQRQAAATLALVALGASATVFMLVRAAHDPGVNQGNPSTWDAFLGVIGRRQYDVPGLWPRRAPPWIQLANLVQYADWQVAWGLDDAAGASWLRTPWSILFAVLAVIGARWHRRRDARGARAVGLLLLSGTLGVVAVLNLRAGPSIGYGVLPAGALHEARERDYFFALAFAAAALWAGVGAVAMARRFSPRSAWAGLVLAAAPVALNWHAADRRREPDASIPATLGEALLASAPPRAVLLLAGDNDSYAVWYQQKVRGVRRDVTPITLPLLPARWYRLELIRRDSLLNTAFTAEWLGEDRTLGEIADASARLGRPLAVSASVSRDTRLDLGTSWTLTGLVFVHSRAGDTGAATGLGDRVDTLASDRVARLIEARERRRDRWARDPSSRYLQELLGCPAAAVTRKVSEQGLLASTCNFK